MSRGAVPADACPMPGVAIPLWEAVVPAMGWCRVPVNDITLNSGWDATCDSDKISRAVQSPSWVCAGCQALYKGSMPAAKDDRVAAKTVEGCPCEGIRRGLVKATSLPASQSEAKAGEALDTAIFMTLTLSEDKKVEGEPQETVGSDTPASVDPHKPAQCNCNPRWNFVTLTWENVVRAYGKMNKVSFMILGRLMAKSGISKLCHARNNKSFCELKISTHRAGDCLLHLCVVCCSGLVSFHSSFNGARKFCWIFTLDVIEWFQLLQNAAMQLNYLVPETSRC